MQIKNKLIRTKKVYIYFISYVLFIIIISTTFLHANSFKVSDIEISEAFELNFNKNKVIDGGFRNAFYNLISMITTTDDKNKIKGTSLKEVKGMIDSFTISDEKFINDEYFAKLEVTFNKKDILVFLENKNIFPSIPIRNKVLLIPILVDLESENIYLFNNNVFYQKWNLSKKNYHLLDYIITIIFQNKDKLKILSKVNLNNSFKINNKIFEKKDLKNDKNFQIVLNELKTTYENYWKKNNEINTSIKLPLTISINSQKYLKIQELEQALDSLDLISNYYILKLDNENIFFRIIYNGSPKTFLNDMSKKNFDLTIENNVWTVE